MSFRARFDFELAFFLFEFAGRSACKGGDAGSASSTTASAKKKAKKEHWFARDDEVARALRTHTDWIKSTTQALQGSSQQLKEALESVPLIMKGDVKNESKLCQNRLYAVKLVLGIKATPGGDHEDDATDEVSSRETYFVV